MRKPLWLLDEPTGNLDPARTEEVFGFLLGLHAELRPTILLVTHSPRPIRALHGPGAPGAVGFMAS